MKKPLLIFLWIIAALVIVPTLFVSVFAFVNGGWVYFPIIRGILLVPLALVFLIITKLYNGKNKRLLQVVIALLFVYIFISSVWVMILELVRTLWETIPPRGSPPPDLFI